MSVNAPHYNAFPSILNVLILCISCAGQADKKNISAIDVHVQNSEAIAASTNADSISFQDSLDYLMGLFKPDTSDLFVEISEEMADRSGMYLRVEILGAFRQMKKRTQEAGEGLKTYSWLEENAIDYGFCQPYTAKSNVRSGYEEERWH